MSNPIHAKLLTNRRGADRAGMDRASTIRADPHNPVDIMIEDLSCGGCRISGDIALAVEDRVTVGLPGIGACPAHVIWAQGNRAGLVFQQILTPQDVDIARETNVLIEGHFGRIVTDQAEPEQEADRDRLSPPRRLTIGIAAAIVACSLAIMAIWAMTRLI